MAFNKEVGDYCYIIRSTAGNGDNYYVGQSTVSLGNVESFKDRMYTHALAACGISGYGKQIKSFLDFRVDKSYKGIDWVWHEYGFKNSTFYLFNRPGVDSLKEPAEMLLNYGFWAGTKAEAGEGFSKGYSANIGEILLVDYFNLKGSSSLKDMEGKPITSTLKNTSAGGSGTNSVSYNPARSRWGQAILSNKNFANQNILTLVHKNWKKSYREGGYKASFTGMGKGQCIARLTNFLNNPSSDGPCLQATENFLQDILTVKFKTIWENVVVKDAALFIENGTKGIFKTFNEGNTSISALKAKVNAAAAELQDILNSNNKYIEVSFKPDWDNTSYKIEGIQGLKNELKKLKTNDKNYLRDIKKLVFNYFKSNENKSSLVVKFKVTITNFKFKGYEQLYSLIEKEVAQAQVTSETPTIKNAIVTGVADAMKFWIYQTKQDRLGQLYMVQSEDFVFRAIKYTVKRDASHDSYHDFLQQQIGAGETGLYSKLNWGPVFDPLYSYAMSSYRKEMEKRFVLVDSSYNKSGKLLFSSVRGEKGVGDIPSMSSARVVPMSDSKHVTFSPISSANYIYFIASNKMQTDWKKFDEDTPSLEKCYTIFEA